MSDFDETDLRIDVFRKVGVDPAETPATAIRVTHLPSGVSVFVDTFGTVKQNREEAMRRLRRKLDG